MKRLHRLQSPAVATMREGVRRLRAEPLPPDGLRGVLTKLGIRQSSKMLRIVRWAALRRRVVRAVAIACGSLGVLTITSGWVYYRWADIDPVVYIPPQVLPKVNAYDTWEKAWNRGTDLESVSKLSFPEKDASPAQVEASRRARANLLARNQGTLSLVRQGLREPYVRPRPTSFDYLIPDVGHLRNLGRLMAMQAEVEIKLGQPEQALDTALDVMQMGGQVSGSAGLMGRMTGRAIEGIGRKPVWDLLNHVGLKPARAVVIRLAALEANRLPLSETIREDMCFGQTSLTTIFEKRVWRDDLANYFGFSIDRFLFTKRGIMSEYTRVMRTQIAAADNLPPPQTNEELVTSSPVVRNLVMPSDSMRFIDAGRSLVQNRLLMLEFALRVYWLEHGAYPKELEDLVPRYLSALPKDPFRPDKTFCYLRMEHWHKLYSVGPDRIDQLGTPIARKADDRPDRAVVTKMDSVGDIVAGVNLN